MEGTTTNSPANSITAITFFFSYALSNQSEADMLKFRVCVCVCVCVFFLSFSSFVISSYYFECPKVQKNEKILNLQSSE